LLKDEETIDPASIEAEIPMEELGEEEQMKIQELMWKEEQKKKGLSSKDKVKSNVTFKTPLQLIRQAG